MNALESEILLKQILGAMDPKTRQMLTLRNAGHSWQEDGRQFGISAHNAEVQFWYGGQEGQGLARGRRRAEKAEAAEEMSSKTTCMPEERPSREAEEHFLKTPGETAPDGRRRTTSP